MGTLFLNQSSCSIDGVICETLTALPTLCLTDAQARRLWHLDAASCDGALTLLVRAGFLHVTTDGRYHRADHQPDTTRLVTFD